MKRTLALFIHLFEQLTVYFQQLILRYQPEMEGGGKVKKGAAGRKARGPKKKSVSRAVKAGLTFPVDRIGRFLEKGRYA